MPNQSEFLTRLSSEDLEQRIKRLDYLMETSDSTDEFCRYLAQYHAARNEADRRGWNQVNA